MTNNSSPVKNYTLVIIDALSQVLRHAHQMDQGEMTAILDEMRRQALDRSITLLLVDHLDNISDEDDVISTGLRATAALEVADTAMELYRRRGECTTTLRVTGQDMSDRKMTIVFNTELCCWQHEGTVADVKPNTVQAEIIDALKQLGGTATTTTIARFLGKQTSNVSKELNTLAMQGRIERGKRRGREIPYTLNHVRS